MPEPSALTGFAQNRLSRNAQNRAEDALACAIKDTNSRFVLISMGNFLVHNGLEPQENSGTGARILLNAGEAMDHVPQLADAILLGHDSKGPVIAANASFDPATLLDPWSASDVRSLLYRTAVSDEEHGIAAQAISLLHWNAVNRFCGKCGAASLSCQGGYRRDCPDCKQQFFPRTDPVVIMLCVRGDACLLGRSPHFPENWYSALAGFVEPGETMEDAVRRETFEESGISVGKVRYFASQPWPFPHSLMIGVHCEALNKEITMDKSELEDCRWFDREEIKLMIADEHPQGYRCPPNRAIASALIEGFANSSQPSHRG